MGIFDNLFGSGGRCTTTETPCIRIVQEVEDHLKRNRKEIEDRAEEIHPIYGEVVRTFNNVSDTIENAKDSLENGIFRELFSSEVKNLEKADHLFVQRFGYTHHGLYIGNGNIIHYLAEAIKVDSLEIFANGAKIHKKSDDESPIKYLREEIVSRAYRRCGEDKYNLFKNNCENFVRWCRAGGKEYRL
ncbi:hypothetical protein DVV95_11165 [Clostridium botulinum]|uniref:lecithin retinol acyltransferase family protein n=1 Tax=Clostridium botulinum TaxID=1491 RepID=UPI000A16E319|nr:lecithin retinol acyltransferase family protein [Clostridium botulinum]MBN1062373.1 hypothetical protein [Clostridium botulinum]